MNAAFVVHSAEPTRVVMPVTLADGSQVDATVDGLVVELVPVAARTHGTITLRFAGAEVAPARDTFTPGRQIVASFAGA